MVYLSILNHKYIFTLEDITQKSIESTGLINVDNYISGNTWCSNKYSLLIKIMEGINTAKKKKYINIDIRQNHITLMKLDDEEDLK
uniref:Uncharacterized protein n=1 Tax=Mimivirus LCMiAC02 TaxID=2506609 RepID=A0A4D5XER4_9VIRU|nr:MAG: hypothetical protein LCMiAC02_03400 [Mimivirus LCMiAC02]